MILTDKQKEGLELALERHARGEKYTVIAGFAGTGKSTLVKHIIAAIGASEKEVVYCAYTGKATLVLSNKGCKNTSTLHKLLYTAKLNTRTGHYSFYPRTYLEKSYRIVVVDEVSMLPEDMWKLLLRHNVYVLALGDPGQLGPIKADKDSGLLAKPHVFLDEIMRQAEGNEIIKLSMEIRQGKSLTPFDGEHVKIINQSDVSTGMLSWADQVLCATNRTRLALNSQIRNVQGRGEEPEVGDKLICLKNYWGILDYHKEETPLVNGTIGWITRVERSFDSFVGCDVLDVDLITELDEEYFNLRLDYSLLMTGKMGITKDRFLTLVRNESTKDLIPLEFAFGYAITTWKAQGSEWDNILFFEEKFPFEAEEHKRYLYTGVTRASEKIVVVKK